MNSFSTNGQFDFHDKSEGCGVRNGRSTKKCSGSVTVIALPRLLNIKEAAYVLGVSVSTVERLIRNKQLTHFRVWGQLRFDTIHLDQYLRKRMIVAK
jgi:excisionase family DNA binding protein